MRTNEQGAYLSWEQLEMRLERMLHQIGTKSPHKTIAGQYDHVRLD